MISLKTATCLVLLPMATYAQYGYGGGGGGGGATTTAAAPAAPSAPPSVAGQVNIDVFPNGQYVFNPANVSAPNGTIVTFFFPTGSFPHSVTQSSFDKPCTHLEANSTTGFGPGFDSGLVTGQQFSINITDDSKPIWFHCKMPLHCGMGMAGSINAPTSGSNTFDAFLAAAKQLGNNEPTEAQNGSPILSGVNAFATASAGTSGSSSSSGATRTLAELSLTMVFAVLVMLMA